MRFRLMLDLYTQFKTKTGMRFRFGSPKKNKLFKNGENGLMLDGARKLDFGLC